MVRKAARVYRHWCRYRPGPDDHFDPLGAGPDADDVAYAAVRLADNLRVSRRGRFRWSDEDYPSRQRRLADLELRESLQDLWE